MENAHNKGQANLPCNPLAPSPCRPALPHTLLPHTLASHPCTTPCLPALPFKPFASQAAGRCVRAGRLKGFVHARTHRQHPPRQHGLHGARADRLADGCRLCCRGHRCARARVHRQPPGLLSPGFYADIKATCTNYTKGVITPACQ